MHCTVPGSTPNCLAMTRTPGRMPSYSPRAAGVNDRTILADRARSREDDARDECSDRLLMSRFSISSGAARPAACNKLALIRNTSERRPSVHRSRPKWARASSIIFSAVSLWPTLA